MKTILAVLGLMASSAGLHGDGVHEFSVTDAAGNDVKLADYKTKVVLIVNVASKCGFTKQYAGLETLYAKLKDKGLVILGFPCNQFGKQEPGTNEEIQQFCKLNYGVSFPVFAKIEVNGADAHPLYKYLKKEAPGIAGTKAIKWNFTKFLIGPEGNVVKRYGSRETPEDLEKDILQLLGK